MAHVKQLPSGAWRAQFYIDGKRKSITRDTQREAEYAALEIQLGHKREVTNVTVGRAIDEYIDSKDGILSPSTISGYRKIRRCNLKGLMDAPISSLTETIVQRAFNEESKLTNRQGRHPSPKTLANARGLLSSALKQHKIEFTPTLPAKQKTMRELHTPQQVFDIVRGTQVELPCLLAMWLSLSMSEIRGLTVEDVKDGYVTIRHTIVDVDGLPVAKAAVKAYERARRLKLPEYLLTLIKQTEAWQRGEGHLTELSGEAIFKRWARIVAKAELPHMRFHDLRHVNASVMLMLGVPDKYAMERGGWKTTSVMKNVYQHTYSSERDAVDKKVNTYFEELIK